MMRVRICRWVEISTMRGMPWFSETGRVSTGWGMMPSGSVAAMPMREVPKSMPRAGWGVFWGSGFTGVAEGKVAGGGGRSSPGYDSAGT